MIYDVPSDRIDDVVDVIGEAFRAAPDPIPEYVFERENRASEFKERIFRALAESCPPSTLIQASSPNMEAISIWFPPSVPYPSDDEDKMFSMEEFENPETEIRVNNFFVCVGSAIEKLGKTPQWYLHILATRPNCKGKGYSSALMRTILDKSGNDKIPCTLVSPPHNVALYEYFGFEVISETPMPGTAVSCYSMRRDPV